MMSRIGNQYKISVISDKGLTLIEVMLAVSILAIGIVGVLRAFAGSVTTLEAGQFSIDSVKLLKQKITDVQIILLEDGKNARRSDRGELEDFSWEWSIKSTAVEGLNELNIEVTHKFNPRVLSTKTYVVDPKKEDEL